MTYFWLLLQLPTSLSILVVMQTPSSSLQPSSGHKAHRSETSITLSLSAGSGFPKQIALHSQSKSDDKQFIVTVPTNATEVRTHRQTKREEFSCVQPPASAYYMIGRHSLRGDKSYVTSLETNTGGYMTSKPVLGQCSNSSSRSHVITSNGNHVTHRDHQTSDLDGRMPSTAGYTATPVVYLNKDSKGGNIAHVHVAPAPYVQDALLQGDNYSSTSSSNSSILSQLMKEFQPVSKVTCTEITTPSIYVQSSLPAPFNAHQRELPAARYQQLITGRDIGYNTISGEHNRLIRSRKTVQPIGTLGVTEIVPSYPTYQR